MSLSPLEQEILLAEKARSDFLNSKFSNATTLEQLNEDLFRLKREMELLKSSKSWKLTRPLRKYQIYRSTRSKKRLLKSRPDNTNLITVIVTTHNQTKLEICRCIDSVVNQTWTKFELIIWDDGSTNAETLSYLNELEEFDPRIRMFYGKNQGVIGARNSAAREAESFYLLFLDPDDYLDPTFLEKTLLLGLSNQHARAAIIQTDVRVHGQSNVEIWNTENLKWPDIISKNQVPISSLINREVFNLVSGFSTHLKNGFEDWELWARIAAYGFSSARIAEPLFHYSFDDESGRDANAIANHSSHLQSIIRSLNNKLHTSSNNPENIKLSLDEILFNQIGIPNAKNETVIFFVPWLPSTGGAETFLKSLAKGLIKDKRTVIFVSTNVDSPSSSSFEFLSITPFVYELCKFLEPGNFYEFINDLLNRFPQAILVNSGSNWLYENVSNLKSSSRSHLKVFDILYNPIGHLPNFLFNQNAFDGVVGVYENLSILLRDYFQVRPKVEVIPVGIETSSEKQKAELLNPPQIGWLGRLSPEKQPEMFASLAIEFADKANFTIAGEGNLWNEIKSKFGNLSSLDLLGRVDSGNKYLESIDVLINTSYIEGISVTAMEAISLGVPVIAPRIGGMDELIIDGVNGYLYEVNNFSQLKTILNDLLGDSSKLLELKKSTQKLGLQSKFRSDEMIESYIKLFSGN